MSEKHIKVIDKNDIDATRIPVRYKLAAGVLATAGLFGLSQMENTPEPDGPWSEREPNAAITGITLEEGARLRTTPQVLESQADGSSNQLASVGELTQVPLYTIGARYYPTEHDSWYGIERNALVEVIPELAEELEKDEDGIIWVSDQKSSVTENLDFPASEDLEP